MWRLKIKNKKHKDIKNTNLKYYKNSEYKNINNLSMII